MQKFAIWATLAILLGMSFTLVAVTVQSIR